MHTSIFSTATNFQRKRTNPESTLPSTYLAQIQRERERLAKRVSTAPPSADAGNAAHTAGTGSNSSPPASPFRLTKSPTKQTTPTKAASAAAAAAAAALAASTATTAALAREPAFARQQPHDTYPDDL